MKKHILFSGPKVRDAGYSTVLLYLVLLTVLWSGNAQTTSAQIPPQQSVEMGKEIHFALENDVNPESIRIVSNPAGVVNAVLNTDKNKFVIKGLQVGMARVIFTGNSRRITVAGVSEKATSFRHVVDVTVLPANAKTDLRKMDIKVSRGSRKDYKVEVLMGMAFSKVNEEGFRWRNLQFIDGDARIAEGLYDSSQLKLRISGIKDGRTTLVLRGERSENGVWQRVVRELRVQVGTGIGPKSDPPTDKNENPKEDKAPDAQTDDWDGNPYFEGIKKRYDTLKDAASRPAANEGAKQAVIRDFEQFVDFIKGQIDKEIERRPTRLQIMARLEALRDEAHKEIRRLKGPTDANTTPVAGAWSKTALLFGIGRGTALAVVSCPANPKREFRLRTQPTEIEPGLVFFGSSKYHVLSAVCPAAVHAGLINFETGGEITIRQVDISQEDYEASGVAGGVSRNGINAQRLMSRSLGGFVIAKK